MDRIRILSLLLLIGTAALLVRLFYWQVLRGSNLSVLARAQQTSQSSIRATRGNIYSRDGEFLSASRDLWFLYADIQKIEDKRTFADQVSAFTLPEGSDEASKSAEVRRILDILSDRKFGWVPVKTRIETAVKKQIEESEITGVAFEPIEGRTYPEASSAAQLLGFVGKNNDGEDVGYFGLEGFYDLVLSGKPGFRERASNAVGVPILSSDVRETAAQSGVDLVTTIDRKVQLTIEKYLQEGMQKYEAQSGSIVVLDPKTGAVLGMAASPSFDPAEFYKYQTKDFSNPIISASFEPGSIMKPLVMAAGMDAKVITPDTICDLCAGPYKVDKYIIETWDYKYHQNSTMGDILKHSDNVGMVFIGNRLGKDRMADYFDKFGFGRLTGIDLQGEMSPPMREKKDWSIVDLATASFGQGVAVTPIQMARAFSVLANDGKLPKAHVVSELKQGDWSRKIPVSDGEQVISKDTVDHMKGLLVEAVKTGEARWAAPKGYQIAGKTGTAQIAVGGRYDEKKTNASFIAFAPANDPKFLMLVILNEPHSSEWAAETAAPLWFTISKVLLPYFGVKPSL